LPLIERTDARRLISAVNCPAEAFCNGVSNCGTFTGRFIPRRLEQPLAHKTAISIMTAAARRPYDFFKPEELSIKQRPA
jgi:hypothetical protein